MNNFLINRNFFIQTRENISTVPSGKLKDSAKWVYDNPVAVLLYHKMKSPLRGKNAQNLVFYILNTLYNIIFPATTSLLHLICRRKHYSII